MLLALATPASAYCEALVSVARAGRVTDARVAIAAMGITVAPLTATIAETAAALRAGHERLRLHHAIVLATAQHLHATLLTYDDQLTRIANKPTGWDKPTPRSRRDISRDLGRRREQFTEARVEPRRATSSDMCSSLLSRHPLGDSSTRASRDDSHSERSRLGILAPT